MQTEAQKTPIKMREASDIHMQKRERVRKQRGSSWLLVFQGLLSSLSEANPFFLRVDETHLWLDSMSPFFPLRVTCI